MAEAGNTSETASDVLRLPAVQENFDRLAQWLETHSAAWNVPVKTTQKLLIVADELFTNVAAYAYPENDAGDAEITLTYGSGGIRLTIADSGIAYNPLNAPPPDTSSPLQQRQIGGLGIFMVKKLTDSQSYERRDGQNVLSVTFREIRDEAAER